MVAVKVMWMSVAGGLALAVLLATVLRAMYRFATGAPIKHEFTHSLSENQLQGILSAIRNERSQSNLLIDKNK
tara:strand:+ start:501 stop:719 length:219 start_codon:yes stop_codon:yes gene_type:complete